MRRLLPSSDPRRPARPFRLLAGTALALGILALITALLLAILGTSDDGAAAPSRIDLGRLVIMTSVQAGLTTLLSLIVGIALAWALNRTRFVGRNLVIGLFSAAIVTPGLVVAFGLLAIWGRSGWVTGLLHDLFGLDLQVPIFGLSGILAAHVILDASFAARILLARLDTISPTRLKTGQSLGLTAWQRFRLIDWPALWPSLPGLAAIIFLLAFTSFPIVLMLGGGPANQTLEVAIYAAVKLDFDLRGAVQLALVQIVICAGIISLSSLSAPVPSRLQAPAAAPWRDALPIRIAQALIVLFGAIGFGLPLLAVLLGGVAPSALALFARPSFWSSLLASLGIGTLSAGLAVTLALWLGLARASTTSAGWRLLLSLPANIYLAVPGIVLALGFFLFVRETGTPPATVAPLVVVLANALLALPFAYATLFPPLEAIVATRGPLIRSLGLSGTRQFLAIEWPLIARDAGIAFALAFCFSLGDLGVISFFGTEDFATLPLLMYRALGAYRSSDAGTIAALLLILSIGAFVALPPLFARLAHARR